MVDCFKKSLQNFIIVQIKLSNLMIFRCVFLWPYDVRMDRRCYYWRGHSQLNEGTSETCEPCLFQHM